MIEVNDTNYEDFVSSGNCVLQFSATWCGPCKALTKTLETVIPGNSDLPFGKVDIDDARDLASKFGIRSVPTLVFVSKGIELKRTMGAKSASAIQSFLDECKKIGGE